MPVASETVDPIGVDVELAGLGEGLARGDQGDLGEPV